MWGGCYESGSLIWRTRWVGDTRIECREALAMPADPNRAVLLRRIHVDGRLGMGIELAEGAKHDFVLEIADREFRDGPPDAGQSWAVTEEAWSGVAPDCDDLIAAAVVFRETRDRRDRVG